MEWQIDDDRPGIKWIAPHLLLLRCCDHDLMLFNGKDGFEQDAIRCPTCQTIYRLHTVTHLEKRPPPPNPEPD